MSSHPLDVTADNDHANTARDLRRRDNNEIEMPDSNLPSEDELARFDKRYGTANNVVQVSQADVPDFRREAGDHPYAAVRRQRHEQLQLLQLRVEHARRQKEQRREMRHLEYEKKVEAKTAHRFPPVGTVALCGCGISTIALNYPNTGHFAQNPSIPAMQICFAGITQLMVAILEWINGATVMYSIFSTFAAFHLTVGLMLIMPFDVRYSDVQVGFYATRGYQPVLAPVTGYLLGVYLLLFAIWAFVLVVTSSLSTVASSAVIFTVFLTYVLQAIANMVEFEPLLHAGGYTGIALGGGMLYVGLAETVNFVYGCELFPLIAWSRIPGCINYRAMQRKRQAIKAEEHRRRELNLKDAAACPDCHSDEDHAPAARKQPRMRKLLHLTSKAETLYL